MSTHHLFASGKKNLEKYLTTVDYIERRTGLDFFSELDDGAEDALEAFRAERVWVE